MTSAQNESQALGDLAARQLANATKTVPQLSTITPRFLLHLLSWVPVEAGIYRVNRVVNPEQVAIHAEEGAGTEEPLPQTYVDYETSPREYTLRSISTLLDVHTRVSDLYSSPHDQIAQQLRLTIETIKERQEFELVNNPEYGLLSQVTPEQTIQTLARRAHPRRPGRADHQGVEDARLLPDPSARRGRVRPGGHLPRRAAGGRQPVRRAVHHLARHPDRALGQGAGREGQDQVHPGPHRRGTSGRGRACSSRAWSASRRRGCRCGSPGSTGRRSRRTW